MSHLRRSFTTVLAIGICTLGTASPSFAQTACELQKLLDADSGPNDLLFGSSTAISGERIVIGAFSDSENGLYAGATFVFHFDGSSWVQEQKLLASDGVAYDHFSVVAITSGPPWRIVVGAPFDDDNGDASGSVYVFQFVEGEGWVEEAKLLASDGAPFDQFSRAGAQITHEAPWRIVIGARNHDHNGLENSGAAYLFRFDEKAGWVEEQELLPDDPEPFDRFGSSAITAGPPWRIVTGAHRGDDAWPDDPDCNSGSAYVFGYDAKVEMWVQEQKLLADDPECGDRFARSVAMDGDTIVTASNWDNDNGKASGSAYVFRFDGSKWVQEQKLLPSDAGASDHFGKGGAAIQDDTILIGATGPEYNDFTPGSAYLFRFDGSSWVEKQKLVPSDADLGALFGGSAIDGDTAVIGAQFDDDWSGSAYIFDLNCPAECPWDLDGNGSVGAADLLSLLVSWGPCKGCPADFDGNGTVGASDLLALLVNWGPCP